MMGSVAKTSVFSTNRFTQARAGKHRRSTRFWVRAVNYLPFPEEEEEDQPKTARIDGGVARASIKIPKDIVFGISRVKRGKIKFSI